MQKPIHAYDLGDTAYLQLGDRPTLSKGEVVFFFDHTHYPHRFYVIRVDDPEHCPFETRDALQLSPTLDDQRPIREDLTHPHMRLIAAHRRTSS